MILADTNLLAYLLLEGDRSEVAREVLQHDHEWAAPSLWQSEFRNVLANYMRSRGMTLDQASHYWSQAARVMRLTAPVDPLAVLLLVHEYGCSAYDAELVQAAIAFSIPLVTSDGHLIKRFPNVAVSPEEYLDSR